MTAKNQTPGDHRPAVAIDLRIPVIMMVLAATAVPVELRSPSHASWSLGVYPADVLANVLGYVPVGMVLGSLGPLRAISIATAISILAEISSWE